MQFMYENKEGLVLNVYVQPKSSKNMISGLHGDALKIRLTAPPADGAANKMCIKYLATWLNVSKSLLEIISGQTSRTKKVLFRYKEGCSSQEELMQMRRKVESLI